ncbi:unnamed protein product [Diplocarpon coronariae]
MCTTAAACVSQRRRKPSGAVTTHLYHMAASTRHTDITIRRLQRATDVPCSWIPHGTRGQAGVVGGEPHPRDLRKPGSK